MIMIDLNNMVFIFKVNKHLLPDHNVSYFEKYVTVTIIIHKIETINTKWITPLLLITSD